MRERSQIHAALFAAGAMLHAANAVALADGYYDSTWAGGGRIAFQPDAQNASASTRINKIILTPSGNLMLGGIASNPSSDGIYWWIGELLPQGTFAGNFGVAASGLATECQLDVTCATHDDLLDMMLQPNGEPLIVGYPSTSRTNVSGSAFDSGVTGGTGHLSDVFPINDHGGYVQGMAAAPAPSGKIYIAGPGAYDPVDGQPEVSFGVARLNSDLSRDMTFNASGPNSDGVTFAGGVHINIGPTSGVDAALVQSDGKLLLVGRALADTNGYGDMLLARVNADGSLDAGFGAGEGEVGASPAPASNLLVSVALSYGSSALIDRAGRIVLALTGYDTLVSLQGILVGRLNADGSPDDSFYDRGWVFVAPVSACPGGAVTASAVAIDSAGRILVTGRCDDDFIVARFRGDTGAPDSSFGINGIALGLFDAAVPVSNATAIVLDASGRPVIGGYVPVAAGILYKRSGVARLTYDLIYTNNFENTPRGCLPPNCN
jgi:uncharacterized delta-60 repeat protein